MPPHLAELWADRDLYEHGHRAAYTGLAATVDTDVDGLADALYERLLGPEGWLPYADTAPTLRTLHAAGIRWRWSATSASTSGRTSPPGGWPTWSTRSRCPTRWAGASRTRRSSCGPAAMLGVDPERTLMVGDTPADAGAVAAGCAALVLPAAEPGRPQTAWSATLALAGCPA